jgi:glutamate-1-semialdehyde 2,1-aminomutase
LDLFRSKELAERSKHLIPGGVNSPVRSFSAVGGTPPCIDRGMGQYIWDIDGNQYMDFVSSWGPLILGHAHPSVVRAIQETARNGTSFGAPTEKELEIAELINSAIPSMEMMRLVNSGTEAAMSVIRVARAYTGKNKIVKFNGCYHGHVDGLLMKAGSGLMTHGIPTSAGVPNSYAEETLIAEYNQLESVNALLAANPDQVAAIIVEPIAGNMGVIPPNRGFLENLRSTADANGTLLIFDEIITGFRVGYGGAQEKYGVTPDLTCLGKIIGGGLPVGAYGGKEDIMRMVSPLGPSYQAGTLSGNPIALAAGIASLKELESNGAYEKLEALGKRLESGMKAVAADTHIDLTVNRVGSMMTFFFTKGPVQSLIDASASDTQRYATFFHGMLDQGIYLAPSQFEASFISLAHTEQDIDIAVDAAHKALLHNFEID